MTKDISSDQYKIPAFQRKRSLSAKARKKQTPRTALERLQAGIPFVKARKTTPKRSVKVEDSSRFLGLNRENTVSYGSSEYEHSSDLVDTIDSVNTGSNKYLGYSYGMENSSETTSTNVLPELREMRLCGKCDGYFDKIQVAIVQISAPLRVGDRIIFESESGGLFEQTLSEMQINREDVMTVYSGDDVGIKVKAIPKKNGNVYKVI